VLGWSIVTDPLGRIWRLPVEDDRQPEVIGRDSFDAGCSHLSIPTGVGSYVYVHRNAAGEVLYVGSTTNPLGRTANHLAGSNGKSRWFGDVAAIEWIACDDERSMRFLEGRLIEHFAPSQNKQGNPEAKRPQRDAPAPLESCDVDALQSLHRRSPKNVEAALACIASVGSSS
jgi:hypothetical protein